MDGEAGIQVGQQVVADEEQSNNQPVAPSVEGLQIDLVRVIKHPNKRKRNRYQNNIQQFDTAYNCAIFYRLIFHADSYFLKAKSNIFVFLVILFYFMTVKSKNINIHLLLLPTCSSEGDEYIK